MTQYIEIHNGKEIQQLTSDEFPLVINIIINNGKKNIAIEQLKEQENKLNEPGAIKCAYIAEHEDHIYFQPENSDVKIFHNDERIENSVWLKSGDVLRIEDTILSYSLSGDCIVIIISHHTQKVVFIPPLSSASGSEKKIERNNGLISEDLKSKNVISKKSETKKTI